MPKQVIEIDVPEGMEFKKLEYFGGDDDHSHRLSMESCSR